MIAVVQNSALPRQIVEPDQMPLVLSDPSHLVAEYCSALPRKEEIVE